MNPYYDKKLQEGGVIKKFKNRKTLCGGINPYTLTAKLGPARIDGSGPPKDDVWPGQPDRSPAQGVKADLAIKQDPGRLE